MQFVICGQQCFPFLPCWDLQRDPGHSTRHTAGRELSRAPLIQGMTQQAERGDRQTTAQQQGPRPSTEPPLPFSEPSPEEVGERVWSIPTHRTSPAGVSAQLTSAAADLGGSPSKDELQGSLDVPSCGLQGPQAQLVVVDSHVPQLLQLGLPLALLTAKRRSLGRCENPSRKTSRFPTAPAQPAAVQTAPESSAMLQSPQTHHPSLCGLFFSFFLVKFKSLMKDSRR